LAGEQLKLSEHSKSEIGYGLVANREWPKIEPLKSAASAVQRNDSSGEALERTLQAVIRQVLHNWQAVLVSEDPEAVHQMRIGLRRLRTVLQVFRPLIKSPFVDDVERSVRDVAHLVGRLRDADVLASDIVAPLEAHSGPSASLQPLLELVAERHGVMRQQVRTKLASAEMVGLQLRLALLPAIAADPSGETRRIRMSRPATAFSAKALAKCWKKVARQGRHLDELSDEERHELRKDLKTLRYAVECCSPLYPAKKVARFVKKLQKLQELFGYLNDVVLAQDLAQAAPEGKWAGAEMQRAAGYVIGWHTAHAEDTWQTARAAWKKLKDTGRFWE
jgi:CHAD domain-containing protein